VRIAFFVLLALNVIYLAWSRWVAPPDTPAATVAGSPLPELTLAAEQPDGPTAQLLQPVSASSAPQPQAVAGNQAAADVGGRCVSVGPFSDLAHAARGAAFLRERGFNPEQRAEQGETWDGYWVYVGNLASSAEETKVLQSLARAGLRDARAMPPTPEGRRISVGLFSDRDRAERRAQAVRRLGFPAEIVERRQPGTVYWVDLELGAQESGVPMDGLLSLENPGARLEIRACPAESSSPSPTPARPAPLPRDARPAAITAAAGALPG
jgi:hypothetical protein